jgi:hypothetical protein
MGHMTDGGSTDGGDVACGQPGVGAAIWSHEQPVLPGGIAGQLQTAEGGGTEASPDNWLAAKMGVAQMSVMKMSKVKAMSRKGPRPYGQF